MTKYPFSQLSVQIVGAAKGGSLSPLIRPQRLRPEARARIPNELMRLMVATTSGVRLRFDTKAERLELDAFVYAVQLESIGLPLFPAVFDLIVDGQLRAVIPVDAGVAFLPAAEGETQFRKTDQISTISFPSLEPGLKSIEIWLPHTAVVDLGEIRADAPLFAHPDANDPIWVHHGSSISHCLEAQHPAGTWPAIVAKQQGFELSDMSFAGSALLDPFVSQEIRDRQADLISLKLGINLVNTASMTLRTFVPAVHGFIDTIRDGHPKTPTVLISPILCPIVEYASGPTALDPNTGHAISISSNSILRDDELTLTRIRHSLKKLVAARSKTDRNIYYLDGLELLGKADASRLHDGLHPDALGYQLIGARFSSFLTRIGLANRTPDTGATDHVALSGEVPQHRAGQ